MSMVRAPQVDRSVALTRWYSRGVGPLQWKKLAELSHDLMGVVSDGVVVEANAAARERGLAVGIELTTVIPTEDLPLFRQASKRSGAVRTRVVGLKALWLDWRFDSTGSAVLFSARDVTSSQATEDRVEQCLAELRQSGNDLEQFAYAASHDIQEPLRTVTNFVDLLTTDYADRLPEEAREYLGFVGSAATHCRELVRALLSYSRVGKDRKSGWVDAGTALQHVVVTHAAAIKEVEATIVSEELPVVWGDAAMLHIVFSNLLSNALKYSDKPANVRISVEGRPDAWIFTVSDNGIGIAERHLLQIFQVFKRLEGTRSGIGIGLASCKKVVEAHGGTIYCTSVPGKGSSFHFSISRTHEAVAIDRGSLPGRSDDAESPSGVYSSAQPCRAVGWRAGPHVLARDGDLQR